MKKLALILAVLISLSLAQAAHAATLQTDWYVKLAGVSLWGYDQNAGSEVGFDWSFAGGLGNQGPFTVTSPDPVWAERMVSVASVATVSPGTSVFLWGVLDGQVNIPINRVDLFWETDYRSSPVQLQLLSYNASSGYTLLWSQTNTGYDSGFRNVLNNKVIPIGSQPVFRVTVVPEPTSLLTLSALLTGLLLRRKRSR